MPTVLQFRRGTTTQNNNFTGTAGELSIDTDLDTIRVHDASTAGGFALLKETGVSNLTLNAQAEIRLGDSDSSNYVGFKSPGTVASNLIFTLPTTDGSSGQALVTDASGNLSFAAAGATITSDTTTNTNFLLYFASTTTGALTAVKQDSGLIYNPSTGLLSAGALTGTLTNALTMAVAGTGLSGSASYNNSGAATFTVTSNATNLNTASTIVARDGSGNFTAGVITATATAARYADLAEKYASDSDIEAGTVVHFAGEGKVAECDTANHRGVAGIISTDPAYLMNSDQDGVALAIAGRVPCKVTGAVNAGDLMVSAGNGMAMANNEAAMGTVIGKAIEAHEGGDGVIEVLAQMM
jgi:hypothetical protein